MVALVMLPGCMGGGSDRPRSAPPRAVAGTVALELPPPGSPDGGTVAGHGRRASATAVTRRSRFVLRGTVEPPQSEVRLLDGVTGGQSAIARRRGRSYTFALEHLRPGSNRFVLEASLKGLTSWRQRVRVERRVPRRIPPRLVVVDGADPTPAEATLRLDRRRLVATAIGRDAGGMSRIRVSANLRLRCRDRDTGTVRAVPLIRHEPPALQIGHPGVRPGVRAPTELRRTTRLRPTARRRCAEHGAELETMVGIVWAEATNAQGLDRYSADVPIRR